MCMSEEQAAIERVDLHVFVLFSILIIFSVMYFC